MGESDEKDFIIKARGLPWSASTKEVMSFFQDCTIAGEENGIHLIEDKTGRPSGECFVELLSREDFEKALAHDNQHMGKRYIEISQAKRSEMEWVVSRMVGKGPSQYTVSDGFVRMRGLPYGASKKDIADFFSGLQIAPYGITITMDQDGRPSGDAYVEFVSGEEAEKAMKKHKEKIGHRYIELFRSSKADVKYVVPSGDNFRPLMSARPGPYDRPQNFGSPRPRGRGGASLGPSGFNTMNFGSRSPRFSGGPIRGGRSMGGGGGGGMPKTATRNSMTGHSIHMRGLPFEATKSDVAQFFAPINPVDIRLLYEDTGRPKGECDVDFTTHNDAVAAMSKDKQNMGPRYIELFLNSSENSSNWSNVSPNMMPVNRNSGGMSNRGGSKMGSGYGGGYGGGGYGSGGFDGGGETMGGGMDNSYGGDSDNYSGGNSATNFSYNENVTYPNITPAVGNGGGGGGSGNYRW